MRWCRGCMPTRDFPFKGEIQQRAMQPAFVAWLGCPTAGSPSIANQPVTARIPRRCRMHPRGRCTELPCLDQGLDRSISRQKSSCFSLHGICLWLVQPPRPD